MKRLHSLPKEVKRELLFLSDRNRALVNYALDRVPTIEQIMIRVLPSSSRVFGRRAGEDLWQPLKDLVPYHSWYMWNRNSQNIGRDPRVIIQWRDT